MRAAAIVLLATVLGLAGCASIRSARDRIVKAPPRCEDASAQIYFEPGAADLTPDGRRVIAEAANRARGCRVKAVSVLGLADAGGDPGANLELSRRRAQSVTTALTGAGLPAAEFHISAAGQAGATTAQGQADPLRRRAEIRLHLSPPKPN